jgi:hypothetical protein
MLLEPSCERDFLDCSFGFRPGRSAHQALSALRECLVRMWRKVDSRRGHSQILGLYDLRSLVIDSIFMWNQPDKGDIGILRRRVLPQLTQGNTKVRKNLRQDSFAERPTTNKSDSRLAKSNDWETIHADTALIF